MNGKVGDEPLLASVMVCMLRLAVAEGKLCVCDSVNRRVTVVKLGWQTEQIREVK